MTAACRYQQRAALTVLLSTSVSFKMIKYRQCNDQIDIIARSPHAGRLDVAFYLRVEVKKHTMFFLLASNQCMLYERALNAAISSIGLDVTPFDIILRILTQNLAFLELQRKSWLHEVVEMEKTTGRGQHRTARPTLPNQSTLERWHHIAALQLSASYAFESQMKLVRFLSEVYERHHKILASSGQEARPNECEPFFEALSNHQRKLEGASESSRRTDIRIHHQLNAVGIVTLMGLVNSGVIR